MAVKEQPSTVSACSDLTGFKRDVLVTIAEMGQTYGLALKSELEASRYDEINHGRLYPNLDDLVKSGFVEKGTIDKRTNSYELTEAGRDELAAYQAWIGGSLEDSDDE